MDSLPSIKTPERVFLFYGTLVRTSTSRPSSTTTPKDINRGLTEPYVLNRAMTRWDGPAFPNYSTKSARLRTFQNWPHSYSNLTPAALSDAGFFYAGTTLFYPVCTFYTG